MLSLLATLLLASCEDPNYVCKTGDFTISGYKTFSQLALFWDQYDVDGLPVGVYSPYGVATMRMVAPWDGTGLVLRSRRYVGDYNAGITVEQDRWRGDGGAYMLCINSPRPCDTPTVCVAEDGTVHFGMSVNADCTPSASGALYHRNPVSGAPALVREPGHYLALRGGLGVPIYALNQDGTHPSCEDGGTRTEMVGGQCYWRWGGEHGNLDIGPNVPMPQGFLQEWSNPLHGDRTDHRAFIDMNGAYWQNHQMTRAQFPPIGTKVLTDHGEMYYDAQPGVLMYAVDTQHWYQAKPDAGDFVQFAEQPEVDALKARIEALEALCH